MLAITEGNTRNLGAEPIKSTTERKPFRREKDAMNAAVLEIGPHARKGFEYDVAKCDGAWRWRRTDDAECAAKLAANGAQLKANGGKRSILAMAVALDAAGKTPPKEMLAKAFDEVTAEKLAPDTADLDIPAFLARPPETKEQQVARIEKHKKGTGPNRQIKNPPSVKSAKTKTAKGKRAGGKSQSKTAMVGQLLLRKEGCTTADILKATGWPSVSVPAQAKAVGLGLRKEKNGKITRYFGVPQK